MKNRTLPQPSQVLDPARPLDWVESNIENVSRLLLTHLKRGRGDEAEYLTAFFALLKAKQGISAARRAVGDLKLDTAIGGVEW